MQFTQYISGKFVVLNFPARYLCAHVPMHVPLRRKAILQCHKFDAKLISNLKVASMSAHINYLLLFFVFSVFFFFPRS